MEEFKRAEELGRIGKELAGNIESLFDYIARLEERLAVLEKDYEKIAGGESAAGDRSLTEEGSSGNGPLTGGVGSGYEREPLFELEMDIQENSKTGIFGPGDPHAGEEPESLPEEEQKQEEAAANEVEDKSVGSAYEKDELADKDKDKDKDEERVVLTLDEEDYVEDEAAGMNLESGEETGTEEEKEYAMDDEPYGEAESQQPSYKSINEASKPEWFDWEVDYPASYVDDVYKGISFNDRYEFIKELFNLNGDLYQAEALYKETLDDINEMENFKQVVAYIRERFPDWDEQSDEVYRFYMAVRRKFNRQ